MFVTAAVAADLHSGLSAQSGGAHSGGTHSGGAAPQPETAVEGYVPWLSLHRFEAEGLEAVVRSPGQCLTIGAACQAAAAWPDHLILGVDVCPAHPSLPARVRAILDVTGLNPARLVLEIDEGRLGGLDLDLLLRLSELRDLGVGLSLDSFGSTPAGLSLLSTLPLTSVKLHRTLLHRFPDDPTLIRSAVRTAHALGLTVIATGVETEAHGLFLAEIGCDAGQGDLFSAMISPNQAQRLTGGYVDQ